MGFDIAPPAGATLAPPVGGRSAVEQWDEQAARSNLLDALPAWLISAVFHFVLLLLLSLWMIQPPADDIELTLATTIDAVDISGNQSEDDARRPRDFEDPGALESLNVIEISGAAAEPPVVPPAVEIPVNMDVVLGDARELAVGDVEPAPAAPAGRMFAGRDPRAKDHLLRQWGGTSQTEAAVARGLQWLAGRQNADGSWSLHAFHKAPGAGGKGKGLGSVRSDAAGTGLALLPMLGAGHDHVDDGPYRQVVSDGLGWIVEHQGKDGDLRGPAHGHMYAHALCAIVLCEAYAISGDAQLRRPAQAAVDFIVAAQHRAGGWRYNPGQPGDTSVLGWQWMALQSAQMAGLNVPSSTLTAAAGYLDRAQTDRPGGRYAYQPGKPPSHVMTAEALLCRQYQGWSPGHEGLRDGADYLLKEQPPSADKPEIYYWYYATQVMHHLGGPRWRRWNAKMQRALLDTQLANGHEAGSWDPRGRFAGRGGRIYMTALALCTLEVYYRHMPLYHNP
ncbi:MAG: prenyltransferase/squalene oxidase repeat-containing protein [bacterium]